jgi:mono/diheme cytochrome c family protein
VNARLLVLIVLAGAAGSATAQDALRGKRLYLDAGRITGSGVSCVDCHGDVIGSAHGLGKAAHDPAAIAYAIHTVPQMSILRGFVHGDHLDDLAAYIGTPAIPSPDLRLSTRGPAANAFSPERLDFGAMRAGSTSAASAVRLENRGQLSVQLGSTPTLAGDHHGEFELLATDCRAGTVLDTAQGCEAIVAFRPRGAPGLRTASLGIPHDWVGGATRVALIGQAVP